LPTDAQRLPDSRPRGTSLAEDRDRLLKLPLRLTHAGRTTVKTVQQDLAWETLEVMLSVTLLWSSGF
jgi:hypothetical protein